MIAVPDFCFIVIVSRMSILQHAQPVPHSIITNNDENAPMIPTPGDRLLYDIVTRNGLASKMKQGCTKHAKLDTCQRLKFVHSLVRPVSQDLM